MIENFADILLVALIVFLLVSFFLLNRNKNNKKFYFFVFAIIIFLAAYLSRDFWLGLLKSMPFVWNIVSPIFSEISSHTLLGLFYISFFGSLFFIAIPVEIVFLYYLTLGYNPWAVIGICVFASMLGFVIDYAIGFVLGEGFFRFFLKEKYGKFEGSIKKFGGLILVFGQVIPSPIELFIVVLGAARYNFNKFLVYSLLGRILKFVSGYYAGDYFMNVLWPKLKGLVGL
jgi:membrane protein YqaA with SNARE-associated domain